MSRKEHIEDIDFIARSPNRVRLLSLLNTHGAISKREIKDRCTAVRTTLQRNLDALEERGWIEYVETGEYRLTLCGEMITESFVNLVDTVEMTDELGEFLRWISTDSFDLEPRLLADAHITVSYRHDPYATVNKHVEALKATQEFKALLPVVGRDSLEVRWRQHLSGEVRDEIVVSTGAADLLQSDSSYSDMLDDILKSGRVQIYSYDGTIPYFVGIYDELVQIGVEDDEGMPRAMVETDSETVREWAKETFEQYRGQSRQIKL